jgi:putative redox protein
VTTRHIAHATASSGSTVPDWQVDIEAGVHHLVADEPVPAGADAGPPPFGLVMSGLAACTAMTLRMYAERKGWDLSRIDVDIRYDVDDDGKGSIGRTVAVPAELGAEQRQRLAEIAERTPVTLALRAGTPIATRFTASP